MRPKVPFQCSSHLNLHIVCGLETIIFQTKLPVAHLYAILTLLLHTSIHAILTLLLHTSIHAILTLLLHTSIQSIGGTTPETNEIVTNICSCHNFFLLSSMQILFIPACCLLCVL